VQISSAEDLGAVVRATRKWQSLRQDEVGGLSHTFIGELEAGKRTAQLGKVLDALRELGIKVQVELPPGMHLPALFEVRSQR
jgi:hypothetical protein